MKMTFIVETGKVDSNGDKLVIAGIKNLNETIPLQRDFHPNLQIGDCTLHIEDGVLKATADLKKEHYTLFPALGYEVDKGEARYNKKKNQTEIRSCKIFAVGLHASRNTDHEVRTIGEQLENGQAKIIDPSYVPGRKSFVDKIFNLFSKS